MNIQTDRYIQEDNENLNNLSCADALSFQAKMLKIRKFDDKIINILNTELPTESFYSTNINPPKICAQLRHEFNDYYNQRENSIKKCIEYSQKEIEHSKEKNESFSTIRKKNQNMRIFQQELDIEAIHRMRSIKALDERCSSY